MEDNGITSLETGDLPQELYDCPWDSNSPPLMNLSDIMFLCTRFLGCTTEHKDIYIYTCIIYIYIYVSYVYIYIYIY